MTVHTPGTWDFNEDFAEVQERTTGRPLAKMDNREDYSDFAQETIANGKLMAAAPDLLAACEAAETELSSWEYGVDDTAAPVVAQLLRAIAKAKGEAS